MERYLYFFFLNQVQGCLFFSEDYWSYGMPISLPNDTQISDAFKLSYKLIRLGTHLYLGAGKRV